MPPGRSVGALIEGVGKQPSFFGVWQEVQFYNQRIDRVYTFGDNVNPVPLGDQLIDAPELRRGAPAASTRRCH